MHVKARVWKWPNEWMKPLCQWCSILSIVWSHRSRSRSAPGPPIPPLVTVALWALLTLVELTLSHSGGAAPHFRVESHYFPSSLESGLTEIANPDCQRPRFPKTSPSLRTPLFLYKSARAFEYWWFFNIMQSSRVPGFPRKLRAWKADLMWMYLEEQHVNTLMVHSARFYKHFKIQRRMLTGSRILTCLW